RNAGRVGHALLDGSVLEELVQRRGRNVSRADEQRPDAEPCRWKHRKEDTSTHHEPHRPLASVFVVTSLLAPAASVPLVVTTVTRAPYILALPGSIGRLDAAPRHECRHAANEAAGCPGR